MTINGEQQIIAAFKQRDANAFAFLFKRHYRALCFFADKLISNREQAEDIAQEQLMKLWRKHSDFDSYASIKSFLYTSTRNSCIDFLRHSKYATESQKDLLYLAESSQQGALYHMIKAELLQEVVREIDLLPKATKRVFELSFFNELDSKAIAQKLGLSLRTVYNEKNRAVQFIRTALLKKKLLFFLFTFFFLA